jgi:hypothetical protein
MTTRSRLAAVTIVLLLCGPTFAFESRRSTQPSDGTSLEELRATSRLDEIRQQRNSYEAERLVAKAVREELARRDEQAEALYAKAVELDPANERARLGLQGARDRLGLVTEQRPLIVRAEREMKAKRQEALYRFNAALERAADRIESGQTDGFQAAKLDIDRARIIRESNSSVFSPEELDRLDTRLRERELNLKVAIQQRSDAIRDAQERDWVRRIKAAKAYGKRID